MIFQRNSRSGIQDSLPAKPAYGHAANQKTGMSVPKSSEYENIRGIFSFEIYLFRVGVE